MERYSKFDFIKIYIYNIWDCYYWYEVSYKIILNNCLDNAKQQIICKLFRRKTKLASLYKRRISLALADVSCYCGIESSHIIISSYHPQSSDSRFILVCAPHHTIIYLEINGYRTSSNRFLDRQEYNRQINGRAQVVG